MNKKKIFRALGLFIIPFVAYILIRLLYLTCKKKFIVPQDLPKEPCVIVLWHGKLLMLPFLYKIARPKHKAATMVSEHFDGEVLVRFTRFFGFEKIRGSSRRGAVKALVQAFRKLDKGFDVGLTPDGPTGPRHSVAQGVIALAQKKDLNVLAFSYRASSYWQLNSWDKFEIPKPFSTITFHVKNPFKITDLTQEESVKKIKDALGE